ncbi:hypothetical protein TRVL_09096 [Trypanosoma vivax]|nr:hypothetical protein TRVL_09096 [Trypanosoma vivax]
MPSLPHPVKVSSLRAILQFTEKAAEPDVPQPSGTGGISPPIRQLPSATSAPDTRATPLMAANMREMQENKQIRTATKKRMTACACLNTYVRDGRAHTENGEGRTVPATHFDTGLQALMAGRAEAERHRVEVQMHRNLR